MKISWRQLDLVLKRPFKISSQDAKSVRQNVLVMIEASGQTGLGEAEPTAYYNESAESAITALKRFNPLVLAGFEQGEPIDVLRERCLEEAGGENMSVVAALEAAMWDIRGKLLEEPVWKMLGAPQKCRVPTSFTIGMGDPDTMAREAEQAAKKYKILKIKIGGEEDIPCLTAIRKVTNLPIRVDANAAWTADEAIERLDVLKQFGIELIEQPCARNDIDGLRKVREKSFAPVIADESCHTSADVAGLVGAVDGVNIKLVKCGGLSEAAKIVELARHNGLKLMIGCMTSSSVAITAASHIAGLMDYVDLDGNLLLKNDPFKGAKVSRGILSAPSAPGIGAEPR